MARPADAFRIDPNGDRKRGLGDTVQLVAGVDPSNSSTPRFIPITERGLAIDDGGFSLPAYDSYVPSYVGATDNLASIVYKLAGTTVATITFTYDGSNRLTLAALTTP